MPTTMDDATWADQVEETEADLREARQELQSVREEYSAALMDPAYDDAEEVALQERKDALERRIQGLTALQSPETSQAVRRAPPPVQDRLGTLLSEFREAGDRFNDKLAEAYALQERYEELMQEIAQSPALQRHRRLELKALAKLYGIELPDLWYYEVEILPEAKNDLFGRFQERNLDAFRRDEDASFERVSHLDLALSDLENATTRAERRDALHCISRQVSEQSRDLVEPILQVFADGGG